MYIYEKVENRQEIEIRLFLVFKILLQVVIYNRLQSMTAKNIKKVVTEGYLLLFL